jgi:pimeloyl-ACP methyl ester carboxylesterase
MKRRSRWTLRLAAFLLWIPIALQATAAQPAQSAGEIHGQDQDDEDILTLDHFVPHISTVPANAGEQVELFVRERVRGDERHKKRHSKPVVLMVHGAATPAVPTFDLPFENYSWTAFLAEAGFDTFAMDLSGYGLSPRPMMDNPCNTSRSDQESFLIPNPLNEPCPPEYPFRLTTSQTDWDEIDTVVDYIRQLRGVETVSLIGWSLGGPRAGGYAARHPEKVERLFLLAPTYERQELSEPPQNLPQLGVPMSVRTIAGQFKNWDSQVKCENQFTPAIRDTLRATILEFDPVGRTWGTQALFRIPVQNRRWGWNSTFARQIEAPTLIIRGDLDTIVPEVQPRNLLEDLQSQKVFVHVACASHQLTWENQHTILLHASAEWLRHGTFAGQRTGSFFVDSDGEVHDE